MMQEEIDIKECLTNGEVPFIKKDKFVDIKECLTNDEIPFVKMENFNKLNVREIEELKAEKTSVQKQRNRVLYAAMIAAGLILLIYFTFAYNDPLDLKEYFDNSYGRLIWFGLGFVIMTSILWNSFLKKAKKRRALLNEVDIMKEDWAYIVSTQIENCFYKEEIPYVNSHMFNNLPHKELVAISRIKAQIRREKIKSIIIISVFLVIALLPYLLKLDNETSLVIWLICLIFIVPEFILRKSYKDSIKRHEILNKIALMNSDWAHFKE